jgi:septation ring formation regulator EzrA
MKSKEEVETLLKAAEDDRALLGRQLSRLLEDEEENAAEIVQCQADIDRNVGAVQAYKTVLRV